MTLGANVNADLRLGGANNKRVAACADHVRFGKIFGVKVLFHNVVYYMREFGIGQMIGDDE